MPNLSSVFKSEITRLARKEIKSAVDPIRKANVGYRHEIAELKRQVASLQRDAKAQSRSSRPAAESRIELKSTSRFVPQRLKSQRARLGLSAADFGRLVGASGQSIYNWEAGKTVPRESQRTNLLAIRGLGKREAEKRLEALA